MSRILFRGVLAALVFFSANLACNGDDDEVVLPDPTANNTRDSAWNVDVPYSREYSVPATDPGEWFRFGLGASDALGGVIVIQLTLLTPQEGAFYLKSVLWSEDDLRLVESANSDLLPSVWVASRPGQTYYFHIIPVGDPGDYYRYRLEVSRSTLHDPSEPDDDTANASLTELNVVNPEAYLCSPFSDSLVDSAMKSLADFYSLELIDTTYLYVAVEGLGADCEPLVRLYSPSGEVFDSLLGTTGFFDLVTDFQPGRWFVELTDARGFYPQYGSGDVAYNYVTPYVLKIADHP